MLLHPKKYVDITLIKHMPNVHTVQEVRNGGIYRNLKMVGFTGILEMMGVPGI